MNHKHILAYILFTGLSTVNAQYLMELSRHDHARIVEAKFSPDGALIATRAENGTVWIWDTKNNEEPLFKIQCNSLITAFAFNPSSHWLVIGCNNGHVEIINFNPHDKTSETIRVNDHPSNQSVTSISFRDKVRVCIAYSDNTIYSYAIYPDIWNQIHSDTSTIHKIHCSHMGKSLYITKDLGLELIVDYDGVYRKLYFSAFGESNVQTDFSKTNENKFVLATPEGFIMVGQTDNIAWLNLGNHHAVSAQFSPVDDGMILVAHSWGEHNLIYLIRIGFNDNKPYQMIETGENIFGRLLSARFNHDGTKVIATTTNGQVPIWDVPQSWGSTLYNVSSLIYKKCEIQ